MPKEIQNPNTSYALVDALGLKGRYPLGIDEMAVPVVSLLNLQESPYARDPIPCMGHDVEAAAGAGTFSAVGVRAAAGTILQVLGVHISNRSGAANVYAIFRVDGGEADLWTLTGSQNLVNLSAREPALPAVIPFRPIVASTVQTYTRIVGCTNQLYESVVLANEYADWHFTEGFFLDGDDQLGPPACFVSTIANNIRVDASFYCREWRPKG